MQYNLSMNFRKETKLDKCTLSPGAISLLVLANEWSKCKHAYRQVEVILVLLCGINRAEVSELKEPSVASILQDVHVIDVDLEICFKNSAYEIASDFSHFMDLFDELSQQVDNTEDNSTGLLDKDLKDSVLGLFIKRSVCEYHQQTFSQLQRIHNRWSSVSRSCGPITDTFNVASPLKNGHDFSNLMQKIVLMNMIDKGSSGNIEHVTKEQLEMRALNLAELHGEFDHREEGVFALQEAIRLAQLKSNSECLHYTLGWLHKLQSMEVGDILSILGRFIENSRDLNIPMLGMWGRFQQVKTLVLKGINPRRAFEILINCESEFSGVYTDEPQKLSLKSSLVTLLACTLDYFGFGMASLFYAQLLCHIPEECATFKFKEDRGECLALSVCCMARFLFNIGKYEECIQLLRDFSQHLTESSKILVKCIEEIHFFRAVHLGQLEVAREHLMKLETYNESTMDYKSALIDMMEGNVQKAVHKLLNALKRLEDMDKKHLKVLLLADILCESKCPADALSIVMKSASSGYVGPPFPMTELYLAQLQVLVGSPSVSIDLVQQVLYYYANGCIPALVKALLLSAQATGEPITERLNKGACEILSSLGTTSHF